MIHTWTADGNLIRLHSKTDKMSDRGTITLFSLKEILWCEERWSLLTFITVAEAVHCHNLTGRFTQGAPYVQD